MNHPEPSRIREMCDMMERAHEKYDVRIDMMETSVEREPCGTVCCHAGLFVLGTLDEMEEKGDGTWPYKWKKLGKDFEEGEITDRLSYTIMQADRLLPEPWITYSTGVALMTSFLGLEYEHNLCNWAKENPKLWGNRFGKDMFADKLAFVPGSSSITVKDIIQHWREVADRIEELNNIEKVVEGYWSRHHAGETKCWEEL